MDLRLYFRDVARKAEELESTSKDGTVYVTSVYHREKNSTAGQTFLAVPRNAARVIVDNTHRLATPEEIEEFHRHQESERVKHVKTEQLKKQQYIVVVDPNQPSQALSSAIRQASAPATTPAPTGKGPDKNS